MMNQLYYTYYESPIGLICIGGTEQYISELMFIDNAEELFPLFLACHQTDINRNMFSNTLVDIENNIETVDKVRNHNYILNFQ